MIAFGQRHQDVKHGGRQWQERFDVVQKEVAAACVSMPSITTIDIFVECFCRWVRLGEADQVRNALRFIEPHPPLPVIAWTVPTQPHSEFSWR